MMRVVLTAAWCGLLTVWVIGAGLWIYAGVAEPFIGTSIIVGALMAGHCGAAYEIRRQRRWPDGRFRR